MTLASFLAYSLALGIAVAIPGPGIAALVARALGTGFMRTLPMLCGVILGDLFYLTLAITGLSIVAKSFGFAFLIIKFGGAAYLLFLAWKFWTKGIEIKKIEKSKGIREGFTSMLGGLALTLGNPKTMIFYIALLPSVIDINIVSLNAFAILVVLSTLILIVTLTPYIVLASRARQTFQDPIALRWLNRIAATAMTGAAAFIISRS